MIIDHIKSAPLYAGLSDRLAAALRFLQDVDPTTLVPGRHDIDGDNVYAIVAEYDTKPAEQGLWEAHRQYIDVQYVVRGAECIGHANVDNLSVVERYDKTKDVMKLTGNGDMLTVSAGTFVVFYPRDAHMPGIQTGDHPAPVKKIVVKVRSES